MKKEEIPYVLMSLREIYLKDILDGNKAYEYRSRYPMCKTNAFIYISKTKKAIMSYIEFGIPEYNENEYSIPINNIKLFKPIQLEELRKKFPNFVVPQSWYYLKENKKDLLNFLLKQKED